MERSLDLDDIGGEIPEILRAPWVSENAREIKHQDACKGTTHRDEFLIKSARDVLAGRRRETGACSREVPPVPPAE
jgi:hypothetical protein